MPLSSLGFPEVFLRLKLQYKMKWKIKSSFTKRVNCNINVHSSSNKNENISFKLYYNKYLIQMQLSSKLYSGF